MSTERDLQIALRALDLKTLFQLPAGGDEEIHREADALAALLAQRASQDAPPAPAALRARVLRALRRDSALDGFARRLAELIDWPLDRASALLRDCAAPGGQGWIDAFGPGIRVRPFEAGAIHGTATSGLIWCAPGAIFPMHRHRGEELALILSGHAWNSGGEHWSVGDRVSLPPGSSHTFEVPRDGVPLLAAVIVREGFELIATEP